MGLAYFNDWDLNGKQILSNPFWLCTLTLNFCKDAQLSLFNDQRVLNFGPKKDKILFRPRKSRILRRKTTFDVQRSMFWRFDVPTFRRSDVSTFRRFDVLTFRRSDVSTFQQLVQMTTAERGQCLRLQRQQFLQLASFFLYDPNSRLRQVVPWQLVP